MYEEKLVKGIAEERIERLLQFAYGRAMAGESDKLPKRYVKLARALSSHYKVKMKKGERNSFCKKCNLVLIPGKNCTVRIASSNGHVIYRCRCGTERKIFYHERERQPA